MNKTVKHSRDRYQNPDDLRHGKMGWMHTFARAKEREGGGGEGGLVVAGCMQACTGARCERIRVAEAHP